MTMPIGPAAPLPQGPMAPLAGPPPLAAPLALPGAPTPAPGGGPAAGSLLPAPGALPAQPPKIAPEGELKERPPADKISNPFERQATLIIDTAQDWAERLAKNLGDRPADAVDAPSSTVAEMYNFSKYGLDAPNEFWRQHDSLLQMAIAANDPDPYAVAERGALDEVYPYRAKLALLDSLGPEERVKRAEQLLGIHHREIAKGNPHDALPTLVGPAGLPPAVQEGT